MKTIIHLVFESPVKPDLLFSKDKQALICNLVKNEFFLRKLSRDVKYLIRFVSWRGNTETLNMLVLVLHIWLQCSRHWKRHLMKFTVYLIYIFTIMENTVVPPPTLVFKAGTCISDSPWLLLLSPVWEHARWNSHIPPGQCGRLQIRLRWYLPEDLSAFLLVFPPPETKAELNASVLE